MLGLIKVYHLLTKLELIIKHLEYQVNRQTIIFIKFHNHTKIIFSIHISHN